MTTLALTMSSNVFDQVLTVTPAGTESGSSRTLVGTHSAVVRLRYLAADFVGQLIWSGQSGTSVGILSPEAEVLQEHLRARRPALVARALSIQAETPDPIQALVDFFRALPGDEATWCKVIDEPYG